MPSLCITSTKFSSINFKAETFSTSSDFFIRHRDYYDNAKEVVITIRKLRDSGATNPDCLDFHVRVLLINVSIETTQEMLFQPPDPWHSPTWNWNCINYCFSCFLFIPHWLTFESVLAHFLVKLGVRCFKHLGQLSINSHTSSWLFHSHLSVHELHYCAEGCHP